MFGRSASSALALTHAFSQLERVAASVDVTAGRWSEVRDTRSGYLYGWSSSGRLAITFAGGLLIVREAPDTGGAHLFHAYDMPFHGHGRTPDDGVHLVTWRSGASIPLGRRARGVVQAGCERLVRWLSESTPEEDVIATFARWLDGVHAEDFATR